jgi:hypothetical protein
MRACLVGRGSGRGRVPRRMLYNVESAIDIEFVSQAVALTQRRLDQVK